MQIKPGDQCQLTVWRQLRNSSYGSHIWGIAEELFISNYKFSTPQYAYPSGL